MKHFGLILSAILIAVFVTATACVGTAEEREGDARKLAAGAGACCAASGAG